MSDDGDCEHSFVLKDDLGYVCRVCGVIDRGIETLFEFQYKVTFLVMDSYSFCFTLPFTNSARNELHVCLCMFFTLILIIGCLNSGNGDIGIYLELRNMNARILRALEFTIFLLGFDFVLSSITYCLYPSYDKFDVLKLLGDMIYV